MAVILFLICLHALMLLVWFKTDAAVEYFGKTWIGRIFKTAEYLTVAPDMSYLEFLREYYNCFFVRLITCPICVSVWLAWPLALISGVLTYPVIALFGLSFYLIISKLL